MVTDLQFDYLHPEIDSRITRVFQLEVDFIELEFRTIIRYEIIHKKDERKIELNLKHHQQNSLYDNPIAGEIISFKLQTFFKVILEHYSFLQS